MRSNQGSRSNEFTPADTANNPTDDAEEEEFMDAQSAFDRQLTSGQGDTTPEGSIAEEEPLIPRIPMPPPAPRTSPREPTSSQAEPPAAPAAAKRSYNKASAPPPSDRKTRSSKADPEALPDYKKLHNRGRFSQRPCPYGTRVAGTISG